MRFSSGLSVFSLSALLCFSAAAQTSSKDRTIEVPFDFYRNEIILAVKINGTGPFDMMLDTGTDPSAVDLATARNVGMKLAAVGHQGTGGGTDTNLAYQAKFTLLEVGDLTAKNVLALAIDLSKVSERMGKPIHGILGHSLLNNRIVQIDYPKHVVRFFSESPFPKSATQPETARRTTLAFRYNENVLIDGVSVNGKTMTANFDTGSNGVFDLTPEAVHILGLDAEVSKAEVSSSVGYNGKFEHRVGTINNVTIGSISVDTPRVTFFGKGTGHDKKPWGINIGNAFLKDFVVTIDYHKKTITLERP